jgi:hypothetical protein
MMSTGVPIQLHLCGLSCVWGFGVDHSLGFHLFSASHGITLSKGPLHSFYLQKNSLGIVIFSKRLYNTKSLTSHSISQGLGSAQWHSTCLTCIRPLVQSKTAYKKIMKPILLVKPEFKASLHAKTEKISFTFYLQKGQETHGHL